MSTRTVSQLPGVLLVLNDVLESDLGVHDSSQTADTLQLRERVRHAGEPSGTQSLQALQQDPQSIALQELHHPLSATTTSHF